RRTEIDRYGGQRLPMEVATERALWHRDGEEPLPLRWVRLARPRGPTRPIRPLLHRRARLVATDPRVVSQLLAGRSYLRRGTHPPGLERRSAPGAPGPCTVRLPASSAS